MKFRGATEEEVVESVRTAPWNPAEQGRLECRKEFPYNREWNGKYYALKQVRPIFLEEADVIAIITVYVYYF